MVSLENEKTDIKEEIENVLRHMCAGRDGREWSEDMIDKLYPHIARIIEDDLNGQEEVGRFRLTVTEEMVVTALMMYVANGEEKAVAMKKIVKIKNTYGSEDKYLLIDNHNGFGIYQEKTPSGCFVHQSWLITNGNTLLVIESYNDICKEELEELIDSYNRKGKFGVKAVMHCGSLHMHIGGKPV